MDYILYIESRLMAGFFKTLVRGISHLDMFPSSEFLRYKSEPYYKTASGGIISILILTVFISLFASTAVETVNREKVVSTEQTERQANPVPTQFTFSPDSGFMFALAISTRMINGWIDLGGTDVRYFDVELKHWEKQPDNSYVDTILPLTACTKEHFSRTPEMFEEYPDALMKQMICPAWSATTVKIQGGNSTPNNSLLTLQVEKCNTSRHANCISDDELNQLQMRSGGNFQAMMFILSNTINPQSQDYKQPYVDSRRLFSFTLTDGLETDVYIEEAVVETDRSLTPIKDVSVEKVLMVEDFVLTRPISTMFNHFMSIRISKSPIQRTYHRSFQKVDTFFSYVGGLIGTIIGVLFIIQFYSRQAYSISIASQLYLSEDGDSISSGSFHFGYFFLIPLKRILKFICCFPFKWQKTDFYTRCIDEADQQLDVVTLMKKLMFMEKAITFLFEDHQLDALFLFEKQRIDKAEANRKRHEIRHKLDIDCNKVTPINGEGNHKDELGQPQINEEILNNFSHRTDDELSRNSMSAVDPKTRTKLQEQMTKLVRQSQQGNSISGSIVGSLSPGVMAKIGYSEAEEEPEDYIKKANFMSQRLKLKRRRLLDPIPEGTVSTVLKARHSQENSLKEPY